MIYSVLAAIPLVLFFFWWHDVSHWILLPLKGFIFFAGYVLLTYNMDAAQILWKEFGKRTGLKRHRLSTTGAVK